MIIRNSVRQSRDLYAESPWRARFPRLAARLTLLRCLRRRGSPSNGRRFAPSEHRERSAFAQRVSPFRSHPRGL